MTTKEKGTKVSRQAQLSALVAGIQKRMSGVSSITLGGVTVPVADMVKLFQTDIDEMKASAKAKADYLAQVQTERTMRAKVNPTLRQFKNYVLATFGDTQDAISVLEDFGLKPRKTAKLTAEQKAEAQGKAKATRKARGTSSTTAKAEGSTPAAQPSGSATPAKA